MSTVDTDVVCQAFTMLHFILLGPKISGVELAFVRPKLYPLPYLRNGMQFSGHFSLICSVFSNFRVALSFPQNAPWYTLVILELYP